MKTTRNKENNSVYKEGRFGLVKRFEVQRWTFVKGKIILS